MDSTLPIQTLRILVENRHGALLKIVGVFTTRAYNIDSLHVAPDQGEELSQMTVTLRCDARQCELLQKQLMKIVDVVDVQHEIQESFISTNNEGVKNDGDRILRARR
jgi:acetolactate synthase-1/3 small subunit